MFPPDLTWYYPRSSREAAAVLRGREDAALHGGGTGLLRTASAKIGALIDLSRAGLSHVRKEGGCTAAGAATVYSDFIRLSAGFPSGAALVRAAAAQTAATPIRNRITLGGGIADRPVWSDLWPALLAANAEIVVGGPEDEKTNFTAREYLEKKIFRTRHLVTEIRIPDADLVWFTRRGTLTSFDYPVFSLAFAARIDGDRLHDVRIALSGSVKAVEEQTGAARVLEGRKPTPETIREAADVLTAAFSGDGEFSGDYKKQWLRVSFTDGIAALPGGMA
jgi:CO/xanthine dehydrogenase FAD-binding subunit